MVGVRTSVARRPLAEINDVGVTGIHPHAGPALRRALREIPGATCVLGCAPKTAARDVQRRTVRAEVHVNDDPASELVGADRTPGRSTVIREKDAGPEIRDCRRAG